MRRVRDRVFFLTRSHIKTIYFDPRIDIEPVTVYPEIDKPSLKKQHKNDLTKIRKLYSFFK